jgi:hypothetical protein
VKARFVVLAVCAAILAAGVTVPSALNALFDGLDFALGWMGAFWVVTLVSAGAGVLFLLAFPHVSWQRGIVLVKDRIKFNLLAIRIFQDDLPNVLKSTGLTLGWNFAYLGLNLLPMAALAGPFMVVWFQLNALYAFDPLAVGDKQILAVELRPGTAAERVEVRAPPGLEILRTAVHADPKEPRLLVELRAAAAGRHALVLAHGGEEIAKEVPVGERGRRLSPMRSSSPLSWFAAQKDPVVWFGEPVLPDSSFLRAIHVELPPRPFGFMDGGEISIMIWFIVVTLAVGFGLKGVFGVEL